MKWEKTIKIFLMVACGNMLIVYIFALVSGTFLSGPEEISTFKDVILFIWVAASTFAILLFLGYMFYHWGSADFNNNKIKWLWFFILSIGAFLFFIGPLIYYVMAYGLGQGLERK